MSRTYVSVGLEDYQETYASVWNKKKYFFLSFLLVVWGVISIFIFFSDIGVTDMIEFFGRDLLSVNYW